MSFNFHKLQDKRVFYILAGTLVILLVLFVTLLNKQKKIRELANRSQNQNNNVGQPPLSLPLPRAQFAGYTLQAELPSLPTSVKLSDLKTSYTTGEALDIATKIGFKNSVVDDGVNLVLVTNQEEDQQTMLSFNKTNGVFLFASELGYPSGGSNPESAARSFLNKMGLMDDTLEVTATYKRESHPEVTFVELHRSWEKLGLPILNPVGALNLEETERLADVKLGVVEATAPDDPDITWSSDGFEGKMRPNDFNTITVAVIDDNNTILSVMSNVKILAKTQVKESAQTLKTPEEAFAEVQTGKTSFSLVKPTGEGVFESMNVFPNSEAVGDNAVVTDVILTYIDDINQKSQTTLYPYYLFRGTTTLNSGYQAQFVQTVPALKQVNTLGVFAQNSAPTVFPGQGSTLQYGTFNWLSPAPNPKNALACAGLTQMYTLANGGYIGWYPNTPPRTWYYVPPAGEVVDAQRIADLKVELWAVVARACKESKVDPTVCGVPPDLNIQTACYHVSTGSPFVYVYPDTTKKMSVSLVKQGLTYSDPPLSKEKVWNFTADAEKLTFSNGLVRNKLYYEYDKSLFKPTFDQLKKETKGFAVNKNNLNEFINDVAEKAGLNSAEKTGLTIELTREVNKLSSSTLKVGLLDRAVLDQVLPVSITPQPEVYHRFFLYVTTADANEKLTSPTVDRLTRVDDLVVEIGVLGF
ncbi:hypothetical protein A3A74_02100 [Candidatus Roizmanbacteria bacterium RIFCSPLOWO2_01_FULL_35_13]|uniref:Uncharacterized protein n=1 Tax=Candidatus Roizmanbacteria bacterium RIFCSPLOWO2_01_FULL_35_13 TaxID=1802055 RepID=A0A1F7ICM7_9BACT|nr:MAG: hypothetical protein A3A74_02100 [Candidatus Roizmanbacteria bacterium RIFCSPLOWO2_01_FULL_35_13]